MLHFRLPDRELRLEHLVLDFNGTLATDGRFIAGVAGRLRALARDLAIHVLTADTFGTAASACADLPVRLAVVDQQAGGPDKERLVAGLGAERTVAVGNGANDALMLQKAALGLLILGEEGAAREALLAADAVFRHVGDALDFLLQPGRLKATLRP